LSECVLRRGRVLRDALEGLSERGFGVGLRRLESRPSLAGTPWNGCRSGASAERGLGVGVRVLWDALEWDSGRGLGLGVRCFASRPGLARRLGRGFRAGPWPRCATFCVEAEFARRLGRGFRASLGLGVGRHALRRRLEGAREGESKPGLASGCSVIRRTSVLLEPRARASFLRPSPKATHPFLGVASWWRAEMYSVRLGLAKRPG
jgi:hypothetical protein